MTTLEKQIYTDVKQTEKKKVDNKRKAEEKEYKKSADVICSNVALLCNELGSCQVA